MKIKVLPQDFIVCEKAELELSAEPKKYRVYELAKQQWETFDLLSYLAQRWKCNLNDFTLAGIKDRYGDTKQLIAVLNRANFNFEDKLIENNFSLCFKGYTDEKLKAKHNKGNEFSIVIRDIPYYQLPIIKDNFSQACLFGYPNYFDEQRFGSARAGQGFMGKALFLGKMEKALKIYFSPSSADRRELKAFKKEICNNWRQWSKIKLKPPKPYHKILKILTSKGKATAFTQAVNAIERNQLLLALHGYQSFLFNSLVCKYLEMLKEKAKFELYPFYYKYGQIFFYKNLNEETLSFLKNQILPVPGYDTTVEDSLIKAALSEILSKEQISLADLKVRKLPGKAVRGIGRKLICFPQTPFLGEPEEDELYNGRYKLKLVFSLGRGEYATMFIKRLILFNR